MISHAPYWSTLTLRHLSLDTIVYYQRQATSYGHGKTELGRLNGRPLPADVRPHLEKLTGLTYLGLRCNLPRDFGVTLAQLKGLQELRLARGFTASEYEPACQHTETRSAEEAQKACEVQEQEVEEDLQELLYAAAELPELHRLALKRLCGYVGTEAVKELARAAQLQRVELWEDSRLSAAEMQAILAAGACKGCEVVDMTQEEGQQMEV
jgi:hypothetical protein